MERHNLNIRKLVFLAICSCLVLTALIAAFVNKGYVQSIRELVRSTTTASISELTVSKAQYLDEKMRSELLSLQSLSVSISANGSELFDEDLIEGYYKLHSATNIWIMDLSADNGESDLLSRMIVFRRKKNCTVLPCGEKPAYLTSILDRLGSGRS